MTVYVVTDSEASWGCVVGVFSSGEKAKFYILNLDITEEQQESYVITKKQLDSLIN